MRQTDAKAEKNAAVNIVKDTGKNTDSGKFIQPKQIIQTENTVHPSKKGSNTPKNTGGRNCYKPNVSSPKSYYNSYGYEDVYENEVL